MNTKYNIKNDSIKTSLVFNPSIKKNLDNIKLLLDDGSINIYPDTSYEDITGYIYRFVTNSGFLCKGLNHEYIAESFYKVDAIIMIGSSMNILPNGNIYGFALIKFDETHNLIYIDMICSHLGIKGAGDILIQNIENMCKKLFMNKIHLISVESAIPFYIKYGFIKNNDTCKNMCAMIKNINTKTIAITGGKRKSIKSRKSKSSNGKSSKSKKSKKSKKGKKSRKRKRKV